MTLLAYHLSLVLLASENENLKAKVANIEAVLASFKMIEKNINEDACNKKDFLTKLEKVNDVTATAKRRAS